MGSELRHALQAQLTPGDVKFLLPSKTRNLFCRCNVHSKIETNIEHLHEQHGLGGFFFFIFL